MEGYTFLIGVTFIIFSGIISGIGSSFEQQRMNFETETKLERTKKHSYSFWFFIIGIIFIIASVFLFLVR
ncbi:uncharacterized membrane protein YidH (DUF202 family) [Metabacillus crassostreae]|uniref:DUF5316 family protein n=1 Tax=Metabacillus crassostreae TaxID=929098 RepID=UPI00195B215B|nr:DUF5316 family protein [Metabacillus crassostreae]MBM7603041.1 uncharacterized membrane protein YidH (DUF202 family) [Metabacillus crassostreae]